MVERVASESRYVLCAALLVSVTGCHRGSNDLVEKPVDSVSKIAADGPLILLPYARLTSGKDVWLAPWLVDPESGATHRLTEIDASCTDVVRYVDTSGAKQLYSIDNVLGWSSKKQAFFVEQSGGADIPFVRIALGGGCSPLWHEQGGGTLASAFSADGSTMARRQNGVIELRGTDGTRSRKLEWTRGLWESFALSPDGDRLALVKLTDEPQKKYDVVTCDLATLDGACKPVFSAAGTCAELSWSPDGARLGCVTTRPDTTDAITIAELAHPERPPLSIVHAVKKPREANPGRITHFAFSPDGLRVAFVSSHEAGCTAYIRDMGSTCVEALYIASAERDGTLRRLRGNLEDTRRPWWIR